MARMNPVADPARAIQEGFYVAPPDQGVSEQLALRLELEPASTHLVLGSIGSGKTTVLLKAEERLRERLSEMGDHVEYIDVSQKHDLGADTLSGVLVSLVGLALIKRAGVRLKSESEEPLLAAIKAVKRYAHSRTEWIPRDVYYDDSWMADVDMDGVPVTVPGALVPPQPPIPSDLEALLPHLLALRASNPSAQSIFLFDSLDRLPSPERFRDALQHDLRVLKAAGIGVAVVGPTRFIAGNDRATTDLFDHTHFQLPADPDRAEGLSFLKSVLRIRAAADVLPDECLEPLARASGGVLRDLIQLAKLAGNEAYAAGRGLISGDDVARSVDIFGRDLAVGLDDEQVRKLKHLRRGRGFVIRGERELSLLETRRVLLHEGSRWIVHPALAPLLDAIPEAA
jgi:hypothetical protein